VGIKRFLYFKWTTNADTTWAFDPHSDVNQAWPMNEQLRYSNSKLKTGGVGGFPLGDLYRWWAAVPTFYTDWKAQLATEEATIKGWLDGGVSDVEPTTDALPLTYDLGQNYPNPFNPSTRISYAVPQTGLVTLKVFNLLGMEVATLFSGDQVAGTHEVTFNASQLSSGVYFYRLEAGKTTLTRKMVLLK
jgi:hypothetical protein